ncbi:MAG: 30S ribosomal protein S4e [Candidatus Micrarchaeota archaeon]|nr:30S ribosomal protein S4e [Candidatus Micrarchaeota archaeon]
MRLKRLAVPWAPERKRSKYIVAPKGPYPLEECLPLLVVLRDILGYAETYREARKAIRAGKIHVCGRPRKDHRFAVGLFDVVSIPEADEHYRLVPSRKGLKLVKIKSSEADKKISKISDKTMVKGGKLQLNLSDGRNILTDDRKFKTHDSVLISLPDQKILKHLKLEKNAAVVVVSGSHRGELAKFVERKGNMVVLESESKFEQPLKSVIVVGKKSPEVTVL